MGSITKIEKQDKKTGRVVTTYRAFVRRTVKGKSVGKSKVFRKQQEAKDWLNENETKAALAMLGKVSGPTFADLIEAFIKAPPDTGTKYWAASHLDFWKAELGAMKTGEISMAEINTCKAKLQTKAAMRNTPSGIKRIENVITPATVNRYLASLSSVFNYALGVRIVPMHPMKGGAVRKLKESKGRRRILTPDEEQKLYTAAKESRWPMMWLFLRMCLTTAARKSEVLNLHWKNIDLSRSVAMLYDTKNDDHRALPLVTDVKLVLEEMQKVHPLKSDFVFYDPRHPEKPKNIQETWKKVRQRAGLWQDQDDPLDQVVLHSTRHTATTQLIRTESNLAKVQNVTGHKTLSQLNRYTHLNTDESVALAEKAFGNGSGTA